MRQGQNGNPSAPPLSPVRPMTNNQNGGVGVSGGRPQAGSGGGANADPTPAAMTSPRTPRAPPGPPNGLSPLQARGRSTTPSLFLAYPQTSSPSHSGLVYLIPPQHKPSPLHHPPGAGPPSAALPMSPRNPPA